MNKTYFFLLFLLCTACATPEPDAVEDQLMQIIADDRAFQITQYPSMDSVYDRLPSMTEAAIRLRAEQAQKVIDYLDALDTGSLSFEEMITLKLFKFTRENQVAQFANKAYLNPLLADAGFHIGFAFLPNSYEFSSAASYERYIAILKDYPRYVKEHIALLREGLNTGVCQSQIILEGYEVTFNRHIVADVEESMFYAPFQQMPERIDGDQRNELIANGKEAVLHGAIAGYQLFADFMQNEYMPKTRESIGALNLPNGEAYYQQRIKYFTTLDLSADSIHRLGLEEVARIKAEMLEIIDQVEFEGTFAAFFTFLRTDEQFYAKTPQELLQRAAYIAKSMDGKLPELFGKLPRQPYTVNPVPDHLAPKYTGGRYVGADIAGTKPGQYWVNTYDLPSRTLYTLEALSYHEAVPGHHLQTALTSELAHLPKFRQNLYLSAFGEGWGLYSEFLGKEAGFYQDPYSDFGRLTYEMWRACRLVVDTGIHAKGWSREQVLDYLGSNTALSIHEITTETDRYISWPAQALSYKIGELKIKALRKKATESLGDAFDIRDFHDLILSKGTVTLPILEEMVDRYIKEKQ
jgi:uncharacterized protein (DUF885 family)